MVVLASLNYLLLAVLAAVLIQRFRSTRNKGYLVLLIPLVLWSAISGPRNWLLQSQISRHIRGESMLWPLSLLRDMSVGDMLAVVTYLDNAIRVALTVVGFLWLAREGSRAKDATHEVAQPQGSEHHPE